MMSQFQLVNSEARPLTHELAVKFAEMQGSPTERDLNPSRLKHLREKADAGVLVPFHWATAKLGEKVFRVNGQHSATMLAQMNGSMPAGLIAYVDEYQVPDADGLALLFRQFDDRKSARSPADVAGAYQGLFPDLAQVAKPVAKLGIEGVVWYRRFIEGAPVPAGDDVYELFHHEGLHGFLIWLGELFTIKTPELRRPQIVAAIYATFIVNEEQSRLFWSEVARGGVEFEDEAPQTVLDNWLKAAKEGALKLDLKAQNYYQGCLFAWKAYREGKSIKNIKHDGKQFMQPAA